MEIAVINKEGQATGRKVTFDDTAFGEQPNDHAIYLDVKRYLASQRQGTHKSKERSEIVGSTRKIKKQKGTGTARAGSLKSPVFVGGGRAFGPQPRDYTHKLNKKVKELARISALTHKLNSSDIVIVEDFTLDQPSTKFFVEIQKKLKVDDKKSLFVLPIQNKALYLSSRNVQGTDVTTVSELNTYCIVNTKKLVFFESAAQSFSSNISK